MTDTTREIVDEGTTRHVQYIVSLNETMYGPYRARTAEHAVKQALDDAELPSEVSATATVYESPVYTELTVHSAVDAPDSTDTETPTPE